MIYNGKEIKKFGFGLMRLPMIGDEVDIEQTKQMVDLFLENGFTYFDTAYGYLNQRSEGVAKIALIDRYPRESFQFATKLPAWYVKTPAEARQMFQTSLDRSGAGYFDFYLLHNLGGDRTKVFEDYDLWSFLSEQKATGKIKKIGFSMHDTADTLDDLLTKHPEVDFVQLQINYADWEDRVIQSKKCYEVALKHNKPVIIMEPIRGGALANPPKKIAEIFNSYEGEKMSYPQWALRYAGSLDNVFMVLSGMSTLEQMQENISFMKEFEKLNDKEQVVIKEVQEVLKTIPSIPCTNCRYCVPDCPKNILIPNLLSAMNKDLIYEDFGGAKRAYEFATKTSSHASECVACGKCESVCPQFINIIDELKRVSEALENN